MLIPGYIEVGGKAVEVKALIDTGAEAIIINSKLVEQYNLPTVRLPRALTFHNADDSMNKKREYHPPSRREIQSQEPMTTDSMVHSRPGKR